MASRDPLFWKRFSTAVHFDEEQGMKQKTPDSWLAQEHAKRHRVTIVCWVFWAIFLCVAVAVVIAVAWMFSQGYFDKGVEGANPNHDVAIIDRDVVQFSKMGGLGWSSKGWSEIQ